MTREGVNCLLRNHSQRQALEAPVRNSWNVTCRRRSDGEFLTLQLCSQGRLLTSRVPREPVNTPCQQEVRHMERLHVKSTPTHTCTHACQHTQTHTHTHCSHCRAGKRNIKSSFLCSRFQAFRRKKVHTQSYRHTCIEKCMTLTLQDRQLEEAGRGQCEKALNIKLSSTFNSIAP